MAVGERNVDKRGLFSFLAGGKERARMIERRCCFFFFEEKGEQRDRKVSKKKKNSSFFLFCSRFFLFLSLFSLSFSLKDNNGQSAGFLINKKKKEKHSIP